MKAYLVIHLLLTVAYTQLCDSSSQFAYQGSCFEKTCIKNKLSNIKLIPLDALNYTNVGVLSHGITYQASTFQANNATSYQVTIVYSDSLQDQIVSDPVNCIDWRIYQNTNAYDVDSSRKFQTSEGTIPSWPVSSYLFNTTLSAGQIQFNVTNNDLDTKLCLKFTNQDQTQWECFFELAFVIKGITQSSYYLSFTVTVNAAVRAGNVPNVNFVKIIEVEKCAGNANCAVSVTVPTSLSFCQDSTCANIALTPFFLLYINRPFYMLHKIDDTQFAASYIIQDVRITFQSFNFQMSINETEFNVTQRVAGHNIYLLQVPIVAADVLITAFDNIRQQGASIANQSITTVSINTGQILSAADEAAATQALTASKAAKSTAEEQATAQTIIIAQASVDTIAQAAYNTQIQAKAKAEAQAIDTTAIVVAAVATAVVDEYDRFAYEVAQQRAFAHGASKAIAQAKAKTAEATTAIASIQNLSARVFADAVKQQSKASAESAPTFKQNQTTDQAEAAQQTKFAASQPQTTVPQPLVAVNSSQAVVADTAAQAYKKAIPEIQNQQVNSTENGLSLSVNGQQFGRILQKINQFSGRAPSQITSSTIQPNLNSNTLSKSNQSILQHMKSASDAKSTFDTQQKFQMASQSQATPLATVQSDNFTATKAKADASQVTTQLQAKASGPGKQSIAHQIDSSSLIINASEALKPSSSSNTVYTSNASVTHVTGIASCDQIHNFAFQNQCVTKSCLFDKISRIIPTPLVNSTVDNDKLSMGLVFNASVQQSTSADYIYQIQIIYADQGNDQLVSDPNNCIDWRVYQVKNAYDIDNSRVNVSGDGTVPQWPTSTYQFNTQASAGQIDFNISQSDLNDKKCIRFSQSGQFQWECFFEMAFLVKNVTQVSHYFSIIFGISFSNDISSLPTVNFEKLSQIQKCLGSQSYGNICQVQVSIGSDFLFCQDATCTVFQNTPYSILYLNRVFWMIHIINDAAFSTNHYINNVTISFQAYGFTLNLENSNYTLLAHNIGYNIYELYVPIVAEQVLITASGILSQSNRRVLQASDENAVPVTHVSKDLGAIMAQDISNNTQQNQNLLKIKKDLSSHSQLISLSLAFLITILTW